MDMWKGVCSPKKPLTWGVCSRWSAFCNATSTYLQDVQMQ
jgi:hypothetical protein